MKTRKENLSSCNCQETQDVHVFFLKRSSLFMFVKCEPPMGLGPQTPQQESKHTYESRVGNRWFMQQRCGGEIDVQDTISTSGILTQPTTNGGT